MSSGRAYQEHYGVPKLSWESDHEWRCRTVFLDVNKEFYQGDRLAAYSMSWANWKFMGNTYGAEVQAILQECHDRLPQEIDDEIKGLHEIANPKVKFVKSSEQLGGRAPNFTPGGKLDKSNTFNKSQTISLISSDSDDNNSKEVTCISLLSNESEDNELPEYSKTDDKDDESNKLCNELVPGLILFVPNREESSWRYVCIIHESCQRSRNIPIEFVFVDKAADILNQTCILYLRFVEIAKGSAPSKKEAKEEAAKAGIKKLLEKQRVIYKSEINHDELETVEKGQLVRRSFETAPKLDDSNLGNKLLRKMGWKGTGGIGKNEKGISDPVFVDAAEGRKGVGHDFKDKSIKRDSVEKTLLDFIRNEEQNEIRFSNDLSSEERALVHLRCRKFGLKHKSHGKGEERYLVVSKKMKL